MSKSTPSLLALLGLVTVAGYQNRGRIGKILTRANPRQTASGYNSPPNPAGFLTDLSQFFQASHISTALGDLVDRFRRIGHGALAESWVSNKANMPLGVDILKAALGAETLAALAQKTGLSQAEVLLRLNVALPDVVNRFTPNGELPTEVDVQALS